jgi:SAM-dependent methyltransferase
MNAYVLSHDLHGEEERLALMSKLLDPMEREHIQRLGLQPGWHCLEIGSGNGSIARWLAEQVGPSGHVVASDLDTSYIARLQTPCLEARQLDILKSPIEEAHYDLVLARAVLHHLPQPQLALQRMIAALKPGGRVLSIEPDCLAMTAAEPAHVREFWQGWLAWAEDAGVDYFIGRKICGWLCSLGLEEVTGEGDTAFFKGGSPWANYCIQTMQELRDRLLQSGRVTAEMYDAFCSQFHDPGYWTSAINFVACWGRKAA